MMDSDQVDALLLLSSRANEGPIDLRKEAQRLLEEALTTGELTLANGKTLSLKASELLSLVKTLVKDDKSEKEEPTRPFDYSSLGVE